MLSSVKQTLQKRNTCWITSIIIIILFTCVFYGLFDTTIPYEISLNRTFSYVHASMREHGTYPKVLLIYSTASYSTNKEGLPFTMDVFKEGRISNSRCAMEHSNCVVTHDKRLISYAGAVLVTPYYYLTSSKLKDLQSKKPHIPYIFFNLESPLLNPVESNFDHIFTHTATYQRDSHIHAPYYDVMPVFTAPEEQPAAINYAVGKTRLAVIFMSNCVNYRLDFVKSLQRYVDVSVFGKCQASEQKLKCEAHAMECDTLQRSFKFFLALENSYCTDYVSEKFYLQGLIKGLVPIVLSGANFTNDSVAPPNSYIDVLDFVNMKDLGDYLVYLDNNDTAYNEYHKWRGHYQIQGHDFLCQICKQLWQPRGGGDESKLNKVVLSEFWSLRKSCKKYEDSIFQKYLN